MVGADLALMNSDTERMRGERPWCFTNLKTGEGVHDVEQFLLQQLQSF
jgi:urease accessory protein